MRIGNVDVNITLLKGLIKAIDKIAIGMLLSMLVVPFFLIAIICRFMRKNFDVGLGPEPLINNVYHKEALQLFGYTAETFVINVYFITEKFDLRLDTLFKTKCKKLDKVKNLLRLLIIALISMRRYKCLYLSFNGCAFGMLGLGSEIELIRRIEPFLYKLANVKIVVMPYGGDVQEMSRSSNLLFKHTMSVDYPTFRLRRKQIATQIDRWLQHADHVIAGCEWVDYMYYWDTLMLAHFSIDTELWRPIERQISSGSQTPLKILHAPNHRSIKGTQFFTEAVNDLIEEGFDLELILLEKVPNEKIREVMASVDLVADQLIVGWYAMFAIEAMSMEKPVLCYLREDLKNLYEGVGLVDPEEIPIINCTPSTVKKTIRNILENRDQLFDIGKRSREYVSKHHSARAIGKVFDEINRSIGIMPCMKTKQSL